LRMARERAQRGPNVRSIRLVSLAAVAALVMTVMPPLGQVVVHATPKTLSETLTDLPEASSTAAPQAKDFSTAGTTDEVVVSRSEPIETPLTFNLMGVTAPEGAIAVRARTYDGEAWSPWMPLEFLDEEDGPDPGTDEAANAAPGVPTEPLWVGEASRVQLEVEGASVSDLETHLIDSMGSSGGPVQRTFESRDATPSAHADDLQIVSRAQWGADESLRGDSKPSYAREIHMGVVHHTAHSPDTTKANGYSRAEAPGVMRAMYRYHTVNLGWSDLGYNAVVDRFGTIYEGRAGGFDRAVIGAHARGFNTGSFGVSVMGNFVDRQASDAAIESLTKVIGVKSAIHGLNPKGWNDKMGGGTWRPNIIGHRDVGQTSCPGRIQQKLDQIRDGAAGMSSMRFPDVPSTSPHRKAILDLADAGVTNGCELNAFCPGSGLNRAQASSFVMRAFGIDPVPGSQFSDVAPGYVHAPAINALAEKGWLIGYDDGTFRPTEVMTRGQLATLLFRAMDLPQPMRGFEHYPDVGSGHAHVNGINGLSEVGIRGNCGNGNFCPDNVARRDSTASFVAMARDVLFPPEPDPSVDTNGADDADDTGVTGDEDVADGDGDELDPFDQNAGLD
jgi:hypothetical protein